MYQSDYEYTPLLFTQYVKDYRLKYKTCVHTAHIPSPDSYFLLKSQYKIVCVNIRWYGHQYTQSYHKEVI